MKTLSKSRYTIFRRCLKALWMSIYKPKEAVIDASLEARFEAGNVVGDLAMEYLGPFEEVTVHKPDGSLDLAEMVRRTQDAMGRGVENITEASFSGKIQVPGRMASVRQPTVSGLGYGGRLFESKTINTWITISTLIRLSLLTATRRWLP